MPAEKIAYPEWTEYKKKNGLDPLGMQNSSINLYQRLLPGVSNVTQRIRYYGFYAWLAAHHAKRNGTTDLAAWQQMIRRGEALYALVSSHSADQSGVAGIRWANKYLAGSDGETIDFVEPAKTGEGGTRYLQGGFKWSSQRLLYFIEDIGPRLLQASSTRGFFAVSY